MKKLLSLIICAGLALSCFGDAFAQERFSILLLGTDSAGLSREEAKTKGRADAIIALTVDAATGGIKMASIERDLCITIPEVFGEETLTYGINKLCTSSFYAGPALTLFLVNDAFGLDIPYYAAVDISGMDAVIDALGGIEIEITEEERSTAVGRQLFKSAGLKKISGRTAVRYMRDRAYQDLEGDPAGDIARNERQRKVLIACFEKLKGMEMGAATKFATKVFPLLRTNLDLMGIMSVGTALIGKELKAPEQMRFPQEFTRQYMNLHNVAIPVDMEKEISDIHEFLYN